MTPEQLQLLLTTGVKHGASDIHFKCGDPPTYRVNGQLAQAKAERLKPADTLAICQMIVRDADVKLNEVQEYDTSYSLPGVSRFRVNIYRQRGALSLILRIISPKIPVVEELGLPPIVRKIADNERGLILVTGATGSGKSSTLAAMIHHINEHRRAHILTIEDPIEFLHQNIKASVSQREIGIDTRSYTSALRSALRQDPDVILVGEMRDSESIDIALKASETGHLVLSTVHTTDAAKTINRLLAVFPAEEQATVRYRLADNLRATLSQRLLPRADGRGRVLACEVMIVTRTVEEYIRIAEKTNSLKDVIEKARDLGMQTFDQHLIELYRAEKITLEMAIQSASNPADFERSLHFE